MADQKGEEVKTYFKGDLAEYTGKTQYAYGGLYYEVRLLEGHQAGQLKYVSPAKYERDKESIARA